MKNKSREEIGYRILVKTTYGKMVMFSNFFKKWKSSPSDPTLAEFLQVLKEEFPNEKPENLVLAAGGWDGDIKSLKIRKITSSEKSKRRELEKWDFDEHTGEQSYL